VVSNPCIVFPTTSSTDSGEGIGNFCLCSIRCFVFSIVFFHRDISIFSCFGWWVRFKVGRTGSAQNTTHQ
jgi:hypothetical protein